MGSKKKRKGDAEKGRLMKRKASEEVVNKCAKFTDLFTTAATLLMRQVSVVFVVFSPGVSILWPYNVQCY